jgi:2-polyprenyl-6-methoxyphenol hydroxylase-like FAD-dependent oxidoreductase
VYEATDHPRDEAGVFLNVAPNGLSVLHALGLGPRLAGLGFQNDRLVFHNETGRLLAEVPVGGITVKRGSLSRLLRDAAVDAGIRFEFGKTIASVTEHSGCVVAHFANGTTVRGSALIGADGIHSRTRYSCFPEAPKPSYTGIVNLGGVVRTDLPPTGRAMHMIFGRRNFFGYAVRPDGETYWFSNLSQSQEPPRSAMVNGDYRDRLLAAHASDPAEVMRILQAVGRI